MSILGELTLLKIIVCGWIFIINIVTFIVYAIDGIKPQKRIKDWVLLLLPALGGSIGACLGNYCFNTCFRHQYYGFKAFIQFLPGVLFIVQFAIWLCIKFGIDYFPALITNIVGRCGLFGYYLIIVNLLAFVLQLVYDSQYYWLSCNKEGIPLRLVCKLVIIGGAPAALIEKLLFNFKFNESTNCNRGLENFIYGIGIWLFAVLWGSVLAYTMFDVNIINIHIRHFG